METSELEEKICQGLMNDAELQRLLTHESRAVYALQAPSRSESRYPFVVYAPIADVPIVVGDNMELMHRVTFRIHIITDEVTVDAPISRAVRRIMTELGFVRVQTTRYKSGVEKIEVQDFRIGVRS